jgi:hypothetical protein
LNLAGFKAGSCKQTEAGVLRAFLSIAVCAVAWPSMALAAADAPAQNGAFVDYCKTNSEGCIDKVARIYTAMLINATIAQKREWCPGKEANDAKVLTPKVIGWLTAHPETNGMTTNDGINKAVIQLYPCKRQ